MRKNTGCSDEPPARHTLVVHTYKLQIDTKIEFLSVQFKVKHLRLVSKPLLYCLTSICFNNFNSRFLPSGHGKNKPQRPPPTTTSTWGTGHHPTGGPYTQGKTFSFSTVRFLIPFILWQRVFRPVWWEEVYRSSSVCKSGRCCCQNTAYSLFHQPQPCRLAFTGSFSATLKFLWNHFFLNIGDSGAFYHYWRPLIISCSSSHRFWIKICPHAPRMLLINPAGSLCSTGFSTVCVCHPEVSPALRGRLCVCLCHAFVKVCIQVCVCEREKVTLTAKLHLPLRTASSSVCHWCGRLDSGT